MAGCVSAQEYDLGHRGKIGFHEFLRMFRRHLLDLQVGPPHPHTSCSVRSKGSLDYFFHGCRWLGALCTFLLPTIPA